MLDSTADVLAAAVLRDRSASRRSRARVLRGRGRGLARARARERLYGHVLRPRRHGVEGRRVRGGRGPVAQAPVGARRRDAPRRLRGHVHGRGVPRRSRLARRVASFHWGNLPVARRPRTRPRNRRRARAPDASRRRPRAPARAGRRRSPTRAAPRRTSSSRRRSSRTGPRRAAARARSPRHRLDDGHLIVELKYLQAMHVKNRMLKKCCYTLYLLELADRLRGEASRETLKTARKNVVEVRSRVREPAPTRTRRLRRPRASTSSRCRTTARWSSGASSRCVCGLAKPSIDRRPLRSSTWPCSRARSSRASSASSRTRSRARPPRPAARPSCPRPTTRRPSTPSSSRRSRPSRPSSRRSPRRRPSRPWTREARVRRLHWFFVRIVRFVGLGAGGAAAQGARGHGQEGAQRGAGRGRRAEQGPEHERQRSWYRRHPRPRAPPPRRRTRGVAQGPAEAQVRGGALLPGQGGAARVPRKDPASVDFELPARELFVVAGHARRGRGEEGRLSLRQEGQKRHGLPRRALARPRGDGPAAPRVRRARAARRRRGRGRRAARRPAPARARPRPREHADDLAAHAVPPRPASRLRASSDEGSFPRPGTRSRSAACATPTAPSSASSRAASAAASEISSDLRPSRPRRASASDSTPSIRRLGRAKLPRALVLRLLRLGPVRRAARGVPEPAQGPGDGPARTRSRVLDFEHLERRVVSRRSRSTSRRCSGPRLPAHDAHFWIVTPLVGRRQRHGDAPRARASAAASFSRNVFLRARARD